MRLEDAITLLVVGTALCACSATATTTSAPEPRQEAQRPAAIGSAAQPALGTEAAQRPSADPPELPDLSVTCPLEVARLISCVDEYIPMIVDVRIKLDLPPGMAARGSSKEGRRELLHLAREELPEHYSTDKIPAICAQRQAMVKQMPAELLRELLALDGDCYQEESCAGFARCTAPFVERILAMTAQAPQL